jgi:hypothetical protein
LEPLFLILSPNSMNSEWVKTKTTILPRRVFRTRSAIERQRALSGGGELTTDN